MKQNTTIWDFDGASRQLREKRHLRPSGDGTSAISATVLTQTAYDANSNTIRLVDNNGGTTAWLYDLLDRNTVMQFHDGSTRTNVFDAADDVVGYTDENGSVFANTWDVLGRKTDVDITPAAGVAGYNAPGVPPGTLAQGFAFDGLSRVTFARDSVGTVGIPGVTNADVGVTYDSISRMLEEQQTYAGDTRYVTHNAWTSYPSTGFTFPNNRQTTIGFDALYRKNGITETSDASSIAAWQFFGGRIATVTLGNGIVTSLMNDAQTRSAIQLGQTTPAWGDISTDHLGYDGSGRLIGKRHFLSGSVLVGFTTQYDPSSNKLFERALHAESRSALYGMDSMDRLAQYQRGVLASGGGGVTTPITLPNTDSQRAYALDGLGNWNNTAYTPVASPPGLDARTHNKLNQVTAFDAPSAPTPVLYDQGNNAGSPPQKGNGNIIDDGARLNAFDALNRLITVTRKTGTVLVATYAYDALGRRIIKDVTAAVSGTVPTGTSRFLLDGQQIVEELNGAAGSAVLQYVWGHYIDELIQLKALVAIGPQPLSAGNYYMLSDLLYRSAALTGSTGAIVEAYDTDAYGNTLLFSGPGTDGLWFTDDDVQADYSACRYVFTGREWDAETQIYFYRTRYYGTGLGRFLSRDGVAYLAGPDLYEANDSAPESFVDPSGTTAQVGFWSGINSNGYNYIRGWGLGIPDDPTLSGMSQLTTLSTGPWPFAQMNLNNEARSSANTLPNLCPGPTKIAILMIEPATTAGSPDSPCHCCQTKMTLLFNPGDQALAIAGIPNDLADRQRQVDGLGEVIPVRISNLIGHVPDVPVVLPILQRVDLLPTRQRPVNVGYRPTGSSFSVSSWLLSEYLGSSQGSPDYVFVCHSQGCNLLLADLARSCNGTK